MHQQKSTTPRAASAPTPDGAKKYIGNMVTYMRQVLRIDDANDKLPEAPD
jgi:hypothetical protein